MDVRTLDHVNILKDDRNGATHDENPLESSGGER